LLDVEVATDEGGAAVSADREQRLGPRELHGRPARRAAHLTQDTVEARHRSAVGATSVGGMGPVGAPMSIALGSSALGAELAGLVEPRIAAGTRERLGGTALGAEAGAGRHGLGAARARAGGRPR